MSVKTKGTRITVENIPTATDAALDPCVPPCIASCTASAARLRPAECGAAFTSSSSAGCSSPPARANTAAGLCAACVPLSTTGGLLKRQPVTCTASAPRSSLMDAPEAVPPLKEGRTGPSVHHGDAGNDLKKGPQTP